MNLEDFERELGQAMGTLKSLISQSQTAIGVVESMLYMIRKEQQKTMARSEDASGEFKQFDFVAEQVKP